MKNLSNDVGNMTIQLRGSQPQFIQEIRSAFHGGHQSVMAVAPTGFGKTICFSYIASGAAKLNNTTYIGVHRRELIRQTVASLRSNGIQTGIISAGYPITDCPIQVFSVQTLVRRLKVFRPPDLLVIDEAHHSVSNTWKQIIDWAPHSAKLGVTATPIRTDGRGFDGIFSKLVLGPQTSELIAQGWLAQPVLYAPEIPEVDLSDVSTVAGEYNRAELTLAMDKQVITGSAVEHYQRILSHRPPTVVFCVSVEHAKHVAAQFCANGIPAASIDGTMGDQERIDLINKLADRRICCLMSCSLVDEGFDLPNIGAVIDLAPSKSLGRQIQKLGRGLRSYPGKTQCVILDHVENWRRHYEIVREWFAGEPLLWTLEGRKKRTKDSKGANLVTCPKCFAVFPPVPRCPGCGSNLASENSAGIRKIKEKEGELVRIDTSAVLSFRQTSANGRKRQIIQKLERA